MAATEKNLTPRKPQINLGLEADEKKLIEEVAAARGLSVSALVRMLAYDEARRLGIPLPTKT